MISRGRLLQGTFCALGACAGSGATLRPSADLARPGSVVVAVAGAALGSRSPLLCSAKRSTARQATLAARRCARSVRRQQRRHTVFSSTLAPNNKTELGWPLFIGRRFASSARGGAASFCAPPQTRKIIRPRNLRAGRNRAHRIALRRPHIDFASGGCCCRRRRAANGIELTGAARSWRRPKSAR